MYINSVTINNIRTISEFTMDFNGRQAGWHVLIGDNGTGKSSIIRAIALGLIGKDQALGIRLNWNDWIKQHEDKASISLTVQMGKAGIITGGPTMLEIKLSRENGNVIVKAPEIGDASFIWSNTNTYFSAGFGPFRRFTGGGKEYEQIFRNPSLSRLSSHLSLFGEDVALTEAMEWLMKLQYQLLENKPSGNAVPLIKEFINSPDFLPHGAQLTEVSSEGVFFKDGKDAVIGINQMSDGFRSILSLTFELIRQLVKSYGEDSVFSEIAKGNMVINLPGVVLIDEVDAHLHPTWQTRIGQWFLKYFPNMQFIVTSHSPLVCRACEKGSIWRLTSPGSNLPSGEVSETERKRLIYGNILDAYGTEVFGENVSISKDSDDKINELAALNIKSMMGEITGEEDLKLQELKSFLPSESIAAR